jgi:hypothetical protein
LLSCSTGMTCSFRLNENVNERGRLMIQDKEHAPFLALEKSFQRYGIDRKNRDAQKGRPT